MNHACGCEPQSSVHLSITASTPQYGFSQIRLQQEVVEDGGTYVHDRDLKLVPDH